MDEEELKRGFEFIFNHQELVTLNDNMLQIAHTQDLQSEQILTIRDLVDHQYNNYGYYVAVFKCMIFFFLMFIPLLI